MAQSDTTAIVIHLQCLVNQGCQNENLHSSAGKLPSFSFLISEVPKIKWLEEHINLVATSTAPSFFIFLTIHAKIYAAQMQQNFTCSIGRDI